MNFKERFWFAVIGPRLQAFILGIMFAVCGLVPTSYERRHEADAYARGHAELVRTIEARIWQRRERSEYRRVLDEALARPITGCSESAELKIWREWNGDGARITVDVAYVRRWLAEPENHGFRRAVYPLYESPYHACLSGYEVMRLREVDNEFFQGYQFLVGMAGHNPCPTDDLRLDGTCRASPALGSRPIYHILGPDITNY